MKLLFLLLTTATLLFSANFVMHSDYQKATAIAAKEKKTLLMVLKTQYCPWCKKLINETMNDPKVSALLQEKYTVVIIDRDKDEFPTYFNSKIVPVTYVINPLTNKEEEMIIGFVEPERFYKVLQK